MDKKLNDKSSFVSSRKFKYGSVAVAFTVIFCVFILLLNAILTVLSDNNGGFYIDLTEEKIYDLSDETFDALNKLDKKVEIIFCMQEDKVKEDSVLTYVERLAQKYKSANENISIIFKEVVSDPLYFAKFKKTDADRIPETSVIVNCPETKRFVVSKNSDFFKLNTDYQIFAYNGESRFTSTILQTAVNQTQKAGFVTGHGEDAPHSSLVALLTEQGYDVVTDLDLKKLSASELSDYDILIISNPSKDYTGYTSGEGIVVNEIELLNNYVSEYMGNLMVFISPETPALPELSAFLADDWGVYYNPGDVIIENSSNALDIYGTAFVGTPNAESSYGQSLHAPITASGVQSTVFDTATPLYLLFSEKGDKSVSSVYTTSDSSMIIRGTEGANVKNVPVMTISVVDKIKNNKEVRGTVLVSGSYNFLDYLGYASYSNADIIRRAFSVMGNQSVTTGIDYKVLEDTAIIVTQDTFKKYAVALSATFPILIAIIGIIVYVKRKRA